MTRVESRIEGLTEDIKLPIKPFRIILKKYHSGDVSQDSCVYLRDYLLYLAEQISIEASKEFKKYNAKRLLNGLPERRRMTVYIVKQAIDTFFKTLTIDNLGEVEPLHQTLLFPDGVKHE